MVLVVGTQHLDGVVALLQRMGERHFIIGEIKKGPREVVFAS
jgi:phosphoribosylaminoimidazole (AIR) synthetase